MKTKQDFLSILSQANTIISEINSVSSNLGTSNPSTDILTRAETTIRSGIESALEGVTNGVIQAGTSIIDHELHISTINSAIQTAASLINTVNQTLHSETLSAIVGTVESIQSEVQDFVESALELDIEALQEQFDSIANGVESFGNSDLITSAKGLIQGLFFQGNVIFELDNVQGNFLEAMQDVIHEGIREVVQSPIVVNTEELLEDIIEKTAFPPTVTEIEETLESTGELIFDFIDMLWNSGFIQNLISSHIVNWFMDWILPSSQNSSSDVNSIENAIDSLTTFPGVESLIDPFVPIKINQDLEEEEGFVYIPIDNVGKVQVILPETYYESGSNLQLQFIDVNRVLRSTSTFVDQLNNTRPVYRFEQSGLYYVDFKPMTIRVMGLPQTIGGVTSRSILKEYLIEEPNQQYNY